MGLKCEFWKLQIKMHPCYNQWIHNVKKQSVSHRRNKCTIEMCIKSLEFHYKECHGIHIKDCLAFYFKCTQHFLISYSINTDRWKHFMNMSRHNLMKITIYETAKIHLLWNSFTVYVDVRIECSRRFCRSLKVY